MERCRRIRDAVGGRRLVVLCATPMEAEPIVAAMRSKSTATLATKTLISGEVAASTPEMDSIGVVVAISGCDKANTAHVLTCLLQAMDPPPLLVLQTGIAGAFVTSASAPGARPGDLVLATEEVYSDTGSSSPTGWLSAAELGLPIAEVEGTELGGRFVLDGLLISTAAAIVSAEIERATATGEGREAPSRGSSAVLAGRRLVRGPFVTSSRVTGTREEAEEVQMRWDAVAESMEGAAAAHICALYEVPFLEIRGVSNMVVDRDRSAWRVGDAVAAAGAAALALCRQSDSLAAALGDGGVD